MWRKILSRLLFSPSLMILPTSFRKSSLVSSEQVRSLSSQILFMGCFFSMKSINKFFSSAIPLMCVVLNEYNGQHSQNYLSERLETKGKLILHCPFVDMKPQGYLIILKPLKAAHHEHLSSFTRHLRDFVHKKIFQLGRKQTILRTRIICMTKPTLVPIP